MFSSSTVNNASPILSNVDNPLSIFVDDMNLISKQDDPLGLPTYYHLLSPLFHNEIDTFDDFFTHQYHFDQLERSTEQVLKTTSSAITDDSSMVDDKMGSNKVEHEIINTSTFKKPSASSHGSRRRRTSKKDRHSKIKTAQGLRDRRMRLSLEVAHPFFKLQDMLGYDKASRTVEWLLLNSKPAIEELIVSKKQTSPSGLTKCTISSASDCEVESTTIDQEKKNNSKGKRSSPLSSSASKSTVVPKEISKPTRKPNRPTKESRTEARARARKRTLERRIIQSRQNQDNNKQVGKSRLSSCSTWDGFEMIETYNDLNSQSQYNGIYPDIEIQDHVNGSFAGNWSPLLTTFSCQQNVEISQSAPSYRVSAQQNIPL